MEEIPAEFILNWHQPGIKIVPSSTWTMEQQGSKRVEEVGVNDKRLITAVFCGSLVGEFLPIQLIYQGKIKHRHLQLQCCAHGVVHARVSFGCCAAVSVRKVHRCRLTAVGVMCCAACAVLGKVHRCRLTAVKVMCCAACAVLGIQYVLLRHWKRFYN